MIVLTIGLALGSDVPSTGSNGMLTLNERTEEDDEVCGDNLSTALFNCGESCRGGKFSDDQSRNKCYLACSDAYSSDSESGCKTRYMDMKDSFGSGDPTSEPNERKKGKKGKKVKPGKQAEKPDCEERIGKVKKACIGSCDKRFGDSDQSDQKSICETACEEYKI